MTAPANSDDDLDAFLQGRDTLSQRLKALPQPQPPEIVSAAIDAHVERELRDEARRPLAANDSISGAAAVQRPRSRRLFASMALAAGLLLVAGVSLQWRQHDVPAPDMVAAQSAAPAAAGRPADPVTPVPAVSPVTVAPPRMLAQADIAPSTVVRSGPAPALAPAPASARSATQAAAADENAEQWLEMIDGLLTNGMQRDALEEWREFRRVYPGYPVARSLHARIDDAARNTAASSASP